MIVAVQSADAALLLTNRISSVAADPLKAKEFWALRSAADPADLVGLGATEMAGLLGDAELAERVARLLDSATGFSLAREELQAKGIVMVAPGHADYPARLVERLGTAAPPMLYVAGPVGWLATGLLGVVGSRSVDEAGGVVAAASAAVAARLGCGIVSGGAKGVDLLSMAAATAAGIPCVAVTAEGLERSSRRKELRGEVGSGRLCLASPYAPAAGFSAGIAMGRNKLIYALAITTLVVAADIDSGGTWAGATESMRRGFGAVAAWTGAGSGPGNAALVERGAIPVVELDDWSPSDSPPPERAPESSQLGFGI